MTGKLNFIRILPRHAGYKRQGFTLYSEFVLMHLRKR